MNEKTEKITHSELCIAAYRWGKGTAGCKFGFREFSCGGISQYRYLESPDYLGFFRQFGKVYSVLVECKSSRSDFFADDKKWFRHDDESQFGSYRFYMVPAGLVHQNEVPEGWGLLYAKPRVGLPGYYTVRLMKSPPGWKPRLVGDARKCGIIELEIMYDALNRMQNVTLFESMFYDRR